MCLLFLYVFHHANCEERSVPQNTRTIPIMYFCCCNGRVEGPKYVVKM